MVSAAQRIVNFCMVNKIKKYKDSVVEIEFHESAFEAKPKTGTVELTDKQIAEALGVPEKPLTEEQMLFWSTDFDPEKVKSPHEIIEAQQQGKTS